VVAARFAFTRTMDGSRRFRLTAPCAIDCEIAFRQGEAVRLRLPRRLAEPGLLLPFEEVAESPALDSRWKGVPRD
jgi:hypothetical protein